MKTGFKPFISVPSGTLVDTSLTYSAKYFVPVRDDEWGKISLFYRYSAPNGAKSTKHE